jgi:ATP-binding cassette subfamily B protein
MINYEDEVSKVKVTDKKIAKRLFGFAKGYEKKFGIALFLMVVNVGISLLTPVLFGLGASYLGEDIIEFDKIIILIVIFAVLYLLQTVIQYFQAMILQKTGQKIVFNVRGGIFSHILKFSTNQFNQLPVGKLVTRVTNDTNTLNEMYTSVLINLLKNTLTVIGVLIVMFIVNKELALIVLVLSPVLFAITFIFRKLARAAYRKVRTNLTNVNTFLSENISGMKITQVFNQEEKKYQEFRNRNIALKNSSIKEIFIFGVFRPSIYVIYILTLGLVLYFAATSAIGGVALISTVILYPTIITFVQLVDMLFNPLQELAEQFNILQASFASSEKIFSIMDTIPEVRDEADAIEVENLEGEIEFRNVWFSYLPDEWILKDVSFKINKNDTVAFVGATGSGKTTILSLIVRNYDIQKGQILIDGIDIKRFKVSSLRRNIGQMLQDVFLFSGTIKSNIQMKEETISDDDVISAARYVNADSFINKLPAKYDEEVRERGNNFSSGQRQLLSFARTVVHKPKIMILDEATANIDTETESLIQDSLEKIMNIGTMLIVAHRLSTIQHADKIIVLQKGEIMENGNHQELLQKRGHYYKLYQLQYQEADKE